MEFFTILRRNWLVFTLSCSAALALIFISEGTYMRSRATLDGLVTMATARTTLLTFARDIADAETGQRGYMVTGRKGFREPYDNALKRIDESLQYMHSYFDGEPGPKEILRQLHEMTANKLSGLALTIQLFDDGKADAAKEIVLSGIGKEQMDSIRAHVMALQAHETAKIDRNQREVYRAILLNRIGVSALTAISLFALFFYLRQSFALTQKQLELQRLLQAERDRLEAEVLLRTAQLTELAHHLQSAREDERSHLARNLHDDLGALLTSAKLDVARIKSRVAKTAPDTLVLLAHLVTTLNKGIALGRGIIENLRPSALSNLGLVAALDILVKEFAESTSVTAHCTLQPVRLSATTELLVYRVVQESLTNITKYASAGNVWVSLSLVDGNAEISVRDDGVGFDPSLKAKQAYGLVGMLYRIEAERGDLKIKSAPGEGTLIQVRLPQSDSGAAHDKQTA